MKPKTTLVHPILGERTFEEAHARRLMAMINNGGWEFKKPVVEGKSLRPNSKKKADAADPGTDQRITQGSDEEGHNPEG